MKYYFDTSAINQLLDDSLVAEDQKQGFLQSNEVYVSCLCIIEAASTSDQNRRINLLNLLKTLANNLVPLNFPSRILLLSLQQYLRGADTMDWSLSSKNGLLVALEEPNLINEQDLKELHTYQSNEEAWFKTMHQEARKEMQKASSGASIKTGDDLIALYCQNVDFLEAFFQPMFQRCGFPNLVGRSKEILDHLEPWRFYFGCIAHGIYDRGVQEQNYGGEKAGSIDTQQGIYLAVSDCFVTHDGPQQDILERVEWLGHRRRRVMKYSSSIFNE